jgi:hypothetical protein
MLVLATSTPSPHNGTTKDHFRLCHAQHAWLEPYRRLGQTRHPCRLLILPLPSCGQALARTSHRPLASQHSPSRQLYPLKSLRRRRYRRSAIRNPPGGQEPRRPTYGYGGGSPPDRRTPPCYLSPRSCTMASIVPFQASPH